MSDRLKGKRAFVTAAAAVTNARLPLRRSDILFSLRTVGNYFSSYAGLTRVPIHF